MAKPIVGARRRPLNRRTSRGSLKVLHYLNPMFLTIGSLTFIRKSGAARTILTASWTSWASSAIRTSFMDRMPIRKLMSLYKASRGD